MPVLFKDKWFKGNTHIHSQASDGGMTFDTIEKMYAGAGYDFLFRTDHWVPSDTRKDKGKKPPLLWIDGIELDGKDAHGSYMHVVCLGRVSGIGRGMEFPQAMESARKQGALRILAHPHWTGNTFDDALRTDFDGVEIYNHVCRWLNGKGNSLPFWNAMMQRRGGHVLGFAVDDAHLRPEHPGWNGGWIMVNAPKLTPANILNAIRKGRYYSTVGPEIHELQMKDGEVVFKTSPVQFARIVGAGWDGLRMGSFDGTTFTKGRLQLPEEWTYAYLEIEDAQGRCAWTNNLLAEAT